MNSLINVATSSVLFYRLFRHVCLAPFVLSCIMLGRVEFSLTSFAFSALTCSAKYVEFADSFSLSLDRCFPLRKNSSRS